MRIFVANLQLSMSVLTQNVETVTSLRTVPRLACRVVVQGLVNEYRMQSMLPIMPLI